MSTAKLLKQAKKLIVTRAEARLTATNAHSEVNKYLQEAVLLSRTVSDSMEIYHLTDDNKLKDVAWRKATTLLGTSTKHLWDLALIRGNYHHAPQDVEFRKKEEIILSKITVEWLLALDKELPRQYYDTLRRIFGTELRTRFEQEARAATSYAQYELVSEHYQNLPVDTTGVWDENGWRPHEPGSNHRPTNWALG
jgi:hypothetical protein